jgi:hypothetical protein
MLFQSANEIGDRGAIKLSEALKSNSSLTSLDLFCNRLVASFHSNSIQLIRLVLKATKLFEAFKSNTSLTSLSLNRNILVASFHSHSIQIMILVLKGLSAYLKHSSQIHLSLLSILAVPALFVHFILTQYR